MLAGTVMLYLPSCDDFTLKLSIFSSGEVVSSAMARVLHGSEVAIVFRWWSRVVDDKIQWGLLDTLALSTSREGKAGED